MLCRGGSCARPRPQWLAQSAMPTSSKSFLSVRKGKRETKTCEKNAPKTCRFQDLFLILQLQQDTSESLVDTSEQSGSVS